MKKFALSLCFVAFLSAGLVSCADEAADVTPQTEVVSPQYQTIEDGSKPKSERP